MGNNTPDLRFKGFIEDWKSHELGDIVDYNKGFAFKSKDYRKEGVRVIRVSDLDSERIKDNVEKIYIDKKSAKDYQRYEINKSEIIITTVGSKAELKESAVGRPIINNTNSSFLLNQNLVKFNSKNGYNAYFIHGNLLRENYSNYVATIERGNANQANIALADLWKYTFRVPVIGEQSSIGNFFKQLDELTKLNQHALDLLKKRKKAFLQKMFPTEDEDVPSVRFKDYNEKWIDTTLGNMGETFTGLSGKTKEDFGHGDAEFITYKNIFNNTIADTEGTENVEIDAKQNEVKYGDALFTTSSETPEEVGMSSVWLDTRENIYLNSFCFGFRPCTEIDYFFLAFFLRSPQVRKKIAILAQGISRYNISKKKVMELEVKIPSYAEQIKLGNFFKELDNSITLQEEKLESLKQMKKAFLQKMFV